MKKQRTLSAPAKVEWSSSKAGALRCAIGCHSLWSSGIENAGRRICAARRVGVASVRFRALRGAPSHAHGRTRNDFFGLIGSLAVTRRGNNVVAEIWFTGASLWSPAMRSYVGRSRLSRC